MSELLVGVISDTHGLLRPQAIAALRGSDMIIHAGDIGDSAIIDQLRAIAPTVAVRGNIDKADWAADFPLTQLIEVGPLLFYMIHEIAQLDLDPATAGFAAVVYGHSHRPSTETREGVLYLNPGSAGPRRFDLPISVARVTVSGRDMRPELVTLEV
jgi:putative phosphoesterase